MLPFNQSLSEMASTLVPCFCAGLASLGDELPPFQHLCFRFHRAGTSVRRSVAKELKNIFRNSIKQQYGGWISRLVTDNAMKGLYEVHLFARSTDIGKDLKFQSLWQFLRYVLEVEIEDVEIGLMAAVHADPIFQSKFVLDFPHEPVPSWSDTPDLSSETESIFSVESVADLV
jgi:hypothetical protein